MKPSSFIFPVKWSHSENKMMCLNIILFNKPIWNVGNYSILFKLELQHRGHICEVTQRIPLDMLSIGCMWGGVWKKSYLILFLSLLVFLSWVESKGEERIMRWSVVSSALCLYRHQCGVDVLSLPLFLTVPFPEIPSPNALLLQWVNALLLQWVRRTGIIHWNVQLNREWALQKGSDSDQSYDHWTNFQRLQPSDGQVVFFFFSCLFFFIKIS